MQLELQSSDLKERYRTRLLYAISDAEKLAASEELDDVRLLDLEWADLVSTAEAVDLQLEGVKHKFSQITRQQVNKLSAGCNPSALPVCQPCQASHTSYLKQAHRQTNCVRMRSGVLAHPVARMLSLCAGGRFCRCDSSSSSTHAV